MVPEDQALYVCEAQNVFGKVRAEARLVVTGHGSLVDLGGGGFGGEAGNPQGGPLTMAAHPLGRVWPCQALQEEIWMPASWATCPGKCAL